MTKKIITPILWIAVLLFPFAAIAPLFAQDDDIMSETYFYDDNEEEEEEVEETPVEETEEEAPAVEPEEEVVAPPVKAEPEPEPVPEPITPEPVETELVTPEKEEPKQLAPAKEDAFKSEYDYKAEPEVEYTPDAEVAKVDTKKSLVQNAVIEGIQLSSEPGEKESESIISCYFIFRDKPTSYFYETKAKEKLIVFEFNDVELGSSPVPSQELSPIQKFQIRQEKVDANKDIVGLKPEWHDVVKVTFYLDAVPIISVKDEYSVISFSFKWSTNPEENENNLVVVGMKHPGWFWGSIGGGVAAAGGVGVWLFLNKDDGPGPNPGPTEIDITDIPDHTGGNH